MAADNSEPLRVPTLQEETENQQRAAIFRLTPAMILVLASFAALGIGKYWNAIPLLEGTIWVVVYGALLLALLVPMRRWRRQGGFMMDASRLRMWALIWAFCVGSMVSVGAVFGMMVDDLVGRVTFAVMVTGLGGIVLAATYMIPGIAVAFFTPFFLSMFVGGLHIDPHISVFQKLAIFSIFGVLFVLLIRFNWKLFQSGVKAAVDRETHRLEVLERRSEMDAARRIQMGLLPSAGQALKEEGRFDLAAQLEPAREMTGDLYDFFMIDDSRLFFLVGDVCGKGVTSSLLMAITKTVVKNAVLRREQSLGAVMTEVNTELMREEHEAQFVTCLAGILDLSSGMIEYTNAGHEPMLLMRGNGDVEPSPLAGGPPFCTVDGLEYETGSIQLRAGDGLLAVSDGVTEAELFEGRPLGQDGLTELIRTLPKDARPSIIIEGVQRHLADGVVSAPDDRTLLAIRYHSASI